MPRLNIVKSFTILGAILGLTYGLLVVLAPNFKVGTSRMIVPEAFFPKPPENVAPGTPAPGSVKAKRVILSSVFFVPFGAMVGIGIGLLLDGAWRSIRGSRGKK